MIELNRELINQDFSLGESNNPVKYISKINYQKEAVGCICFDNNRTMVTHFITISKSSLKLVGDIDAMELMDEWTPKNDSYEIETILLSKGYKLEENIIYL